GRTERAVGRAKALEHSADWKSASLAKYRPAEFVGDRCRISPPDEYRSARTAGERSARSKCPRRARHSRRPPAGRASSRRARRRCSPQPPPQAAHTGLRRATNRSLTDTSAVVRLTWTPPLLLALSDRVAGHGSRVGRLQSCSA